MKDGFIKIAAAAPDLRLADCQYNSRKLSQAARQAAGQGIRLLVTPELSLTGYTCGDLFFSQSLLDEAEEALAALLKDTQDLPLILAVGLPVRCLGKLYNCAAVLYQGDILGLVPKANLPGYDEFQEPRWFTPAPKGMCAVTLWGKQIPFGARMRFACAQLPAFVFGVEICEDLWVPSPPSVDMCREGAALIVNLCASHDGAGLPDAHRALVAANSRRCHCAYLLANAGVGESTTDLVFSGQQLIAEDGELLAESPPFAQPSLAVTEVDLQRVLSVRARTTSYPGSLPEAPAPVFFSMEPTETLLSRKIPQDPFLPEADLTGQTCGQIFQLQSQALARRLSHIHAQTAVVGVSGGLDSTLALLVSAQAMALLEQDAQRVVAVTMPCFGTSHRTKNNAQILCQELGLALREIPVGPAVEGHFHDIGHDPQVRNAAYENAQARERTQVLMDLANDLGGIVVGTGDLSELALGWATYNGDHMSMYGVNAGIPKTQIRKIVDWYARQCGNPRLSAVLQDILDTPISPELLPAQAGQIAQKTEDLVGPYQLHDFFLYYLLRYGFGPKKIFRLALAAFAETYDRDTIRRWLEVCFRRFLSQQYKRSCMPDGPMIGPVSLSPRGFWRMPSDAWATLWLEEFKQL